MRILSGTEMGLVAGGSEDTVTVTGRRSNPNLGGTFTTHDISWQELEDLLSNVSMLDADALDDVDELLQDMINALVAERTQVQAALAQALAMIEILNNLILNHGGGGIDGAANYYVWGTELSAKQAEATALQNRLDSIDARMDFLLQQRN